MNKARAMSREFQDGLAEMAREVELDEIKRNVETCRVASISARN